ncbi:MAG: hypothetical protein HC774_01390 [Sphingomonadales bacterium]|nr:hypothetical protein [Sphingomonadales bacterium]
MIAAGVAHIMPHASLTLLATPWHFSRYPAASRDACASLWQRNAAAWQALGVVPVESFQQLFWAIDPDRVVQKYAAIADLPSDDPGLMRFARLEDWASGGAALPYALAADIFARMMPHDVTGNGRWTIADTIIAPQHLATPVQQLLATGDAIAPASTAVEGVPAIACASGHVGMIVGQRAPQESWRSIVNHLRSAL